MGPVGAVIGSIEKGINFADKAIGAKDESGYTKPTLGNFTKEMTVLCSYVAGASCVTGIISGIPAGAMVAGGFATTFSAVSEGAKGLVEGVKVSMELAGDIVG